MTAPVFVLAFVFSLNLSTSYAAKTCDCGSTKNGVSAENCCWEMDDNGTLIISGVGKMKNYTPSWKNICGSSDTPTWCSKINEIRSVEIKGLENVGVGTFYSSSKMIIPIKLDDTIERIESYSLRFNVPFLELPDSITYIGTEALKTDYSANQRTIVIPDTIEEISESALGYLETLDNLNIICKGSNCERVKSLFEKYYCYSNIDKDRVTVDLKNKITPADDTNCDSTNYYWNGVTCLREGNPKNRVCTGGYAKLKDRCVDPLKTFAKKRCTPAEAAQWLNEDDNTVILTFRK